MISIQNVNIQVGVGIIYGCFIFHFVSLPLELGRPIQPNMCTKVAVKHQASIKHQSVNIQDSTFKKLNIYPNVQAYVIDIIYVINIVLDFWYSDISKHVHPFQIFYLPKSNANTSSKYIHSISKQLWADVLLP